MNIPFRRVFDMRTGTSLGLMLLAFALLASPSAAQTRGSTLAVDSIAIVRGGSRAVQPGPSAQFTGTVRVEPLFAPTGASRASGASVTFAPGARSAWHSHPLGQTLIVTAGTGRVQQWGGLVQEIHAGDVVWTPAGVKHWHGAAPTTAMTHTAIQEWVAGRNVDWLEQVTDAQYATPARPTTTPTPRTPGMAQDSTTKRGPYADIAPALDDLTQRVLFGEVWERPGLSKRDRSLITVATLVAGYRTNELPYHLKFALQNGVTKDELTELITHLAFYAGWPTANSAVEIARKVFAELPK
jgi:4-carboxymuconolactone decarboxylase